MSLRARLALLYTSIVGGILLIFGTAVYVSVSLTLVNQIDARLARTARDIIDNSRFQPTETGSGVLALPPFDFSGDVYIQVWSADRELLAENIRFGQALDPASRTTSRPVYRDLTVGSVRMRVLTVPMEITASGRIIGVLQVGTSLTVVDATQRTLQVVLLSGVLLSMLVAALAGWFSTKQALRPLDAVTQTALQITRADDLSRRIPYDGPPDDEIGQLITAFNQTLGRLENLFESQRRFLADVGHELRTPLTVIRGNVDLMRRMDCIDDESMGGIENEVDRLTRLVGDLLLLAQAESGKLPMANQQVELDTLLLDALQQLQVLARGKVQLRLEEIDQVLVCGDPDRLKQVLVNLIGNAINYTPSGGEVVVSLGKQANRARLTVSDTGPGIPPEDLPHIFERFYRGEKSRTRSRDGKGFGLGLSIAYWIVRNHGGLIEVASRQPQGTTFTVWLPLFEQDCLEEVSLTSER